jgi:hypothetical protein
MPDFCDLTYCRLCHQSIHEVCSTWITVVPQPGCDEADTYCPLSPLGWHEPPVRPTPCQGTWGYERYLGETDLRVMACSDCREIWAIDGTRHAGFFAPRRTDQAILEAVIWAKRT